MKRGLGYRKRAGARRPAPFVTGRLRAQIHGFALPDEHEIAPSRIVDQDGTGTCFACAPAVAIESTLLAKGHGIDFEVSILDLTTVVHAMERQIDGFPLETPLWDCGGDPRDVITAIEKWGVRPARYRNDDERARRCDASPDTVGPDRSPREGERGGVEPQLADLEKDATCLLLGSYQLDGGDPITELRQAIASDVVVTFAWCVEESDYDAGPSDVLKGRFGWANHACAFVGYRRMPDGSFQFRLLNSWGPWADGGLIWVDESFAYTTSARYALDVRRSP